MVSVSSVYLISCPDLSQGWTIVYKLKQTLLPLNCSQSECSIIATEGKLNTNEPSKGGELGVVADRPVITPVLPGLWEAEVKVP